MQIDVLHYISLEFFGVLEENIGRSYLERVKGLSLEVLESLGFKLVEITELFGKQDYLVNLTVWRPGGVTLGDCTIITIKLLPLLEGNDSLPNYTRLSVQSPGVERKLKRLDELKVFVGRGVTISLEEKHVTGTIHSCNDQNLTLETAGALTEIPLEKILWARLVD